MIPRRLAILLLTLLSVASGHAQTQPADSGKIDEFIRLLQDPEVQTWRESRKQDAAASPPVQAETAWAIAVRAKQMQEQVPEG